MNNIAACGRRCVTDNMPLNYCCCYVAAPVTSLESFISTPRHLYNATAAQQHAELTIIRRKFAVTYSRLITADVMRSRHRILTGITIHVVCLAFYRLRGKDLAISRHAASCRHLT